jgi:FkbM family methyltransferase
MPDYEQNLETFYRSLLHPGDVVLDVGAHTGRHTLPLMRAVAPGGKVEAFEPVPMVREELERATKAGRPARVDLAIWPYALADRAGSSEFVVALDLLAYSGLRTRVYDGPTRLERIPVEVRTLDSMFGTARRVDYIKIDAEGGELGILRGGAALIDRLAPVVTFEFGANSIGDYGITCEDMAAFWSERAYSLFDLLGRPLDSRRFVESAVRQEVWDYLALPSNRAAQILSDWHPRA